MGRLNIRHSASMLWRIICSVHLWSHVLIFCTGCRGLMTSLMQSPQCTLMTFACVTETAAPVPPLPWNAPGPSVLLPWVCAPVLCCRSDGGRWISWVLGELQQIQSVEDSSRHQRPPLTVREEEVVCGIFLQRLQSESEAASVWRTSTVSLWPANTAAGRTHTQGNTLKHNLSHHMHRDTCTGKI